MNLDLLETIVKHVFSSLGVIPSKFIDLNKSGSLLEKRWRLSANIPFEEQPKLSKPSGQVWGCQVSASGQEVKILLGNCTQEEGFPEYALLVQLKDTICYGLYLIYDEEPGFECEPMIACSTNGREWMRCNTFLQASFLSGMEQIKETGLGWNKCVSYEAEFDKLLAFIDYHHLVYGESDEGKKD